MKKHKLKKVIASSLVGVNTLGFVSIPVIGLAVEDSVAYASERNRSSGDFLESEVGFKSNRDLLIEDILIKQEENRQAIIEEERRLARELEEKRLQEEAEYIRKESVGVNLDNVLEPSYITAAELHAVFLQLGKPSMAELSWAIVDAERETGVNAMFLTGLIANESGWNSSYKAVNYNNVTGFASYSSSHSGAYFESKYDCIMTTARWLKEAYLTEGGPYFYGYSTWAINQSYCMLEDMQTVDDNWRILINDISKTVESFYHQFVK